MDLAVVRGPPCFAGGEARHSGNPYVWLTLAEGTENQRMNMQMKSPIFRGLTMLSLSAGLVALVVATANAAPLDRLSAEFQTNQEISTTVGPAAGGTVVYDKTLKIPFHVALMTFSATGDGHGGSALLMTASITNKDGVETICQPMKDAGGGAGQFHKPWMTLIKLPTNPTIDAGGTLNNCRVGSSTTNVGLPPGDNNGDGGGGSADCHDNAFMFSCCVLPQKSASGDTTQDIKIKMASSLGTGADDEVLRVFYEESTIYIDGLGKLGVESEEGASNTFANFCKGVGTAPHSDPVTKTGGDH